MSSSPVQKHYADHLAPVYVWMAGGADAALSAGANDIADFVPGSGLAVDLGAGFGMHSIPLARAGYEVVAIDTSSLLLNELRLLADGLSIQSVCGNLLEFKNHLRQPAQLIVCMGDTLPHLADAAHVEQLTQDIASSLAPGGCFVATFRDYTKLPSGPARFIPVRSDEERILTCFLETEPAHVLVHDILHERDDLGWRMKVSAYRKLRLAPDFVCGALNQAGLAATVEKGPRGMVRVLARA